ncbi:MAG: hypothetical protein AB3N63_14820 [Puniceicoccaceae bacterium]
MRYVEFKAAVSEGLKASPDGLTWAELRDLQKLPYKRACPEWTKQLEKEIGLDRSERSGRACVWKLKRLGNDC